MLISKLQYYDINGSALQLLLSYSTNRKQFVQYGDIVVMLPVDTTMAVMCHVLFCLLHSLSWLRMPMRLLHVLPQCRHM